MTLFKKSICPAVVTHGSKPNTQEAEAGKSLSSMPVWSRTARGTEGNSVSNKQQKQKSQNQERNQSELTAAPIFDPST